MVSREEALEAHKRKEGKIEIVGRVSIESKEELSTFYTPGVAYVCEAIKQDKQLAYDYTLKGRTVAIVTNGTRILGLGKIGPEAGMPVMEGKALLYKKFAGIDAVPICINAKTEEEIVAVVKAIEPSFGAINVEDIGVPLVFNVVERLQKEIGIPIFHDDRQGVGVVVLAALINSLKLAEKKLKDIKVVINGAGSAGVGVAELLHYAGCKKIYLLDTTGLIYKGRPENMNDMKNRMAEITNPESMRGGLDAAVEGADVLIGVSTRNAFSRELIKKMASKPIVFALANPVPEIGYEEAREAGAFIVATGRSDKPNQVNNLLAFPGIMKALLETRSPHMNEEMLVAAANAIAKLGRKGLGVESVIPSPTEKKTVNKLAGEVASAVTDAAVKSGLARIRITGPEVKEKTSSSIKSYGRMERFIAKH